MCPVLRNPPPPLHSSPYSPSLPARPIMILGTILLELEDFWQKKTPKELQMLEICNKYAGDMQQVRERLWREKQYSK